MIVSYFHIIGDNGIVICRRCVVLVISSESVIQKMLNEIQKANKVVHQPDVMIDHISKVKLLSELLLEEHQRNMNVQQKDSLETVTSLNQQNQSTEYISTESTNEDGTSIFDF